MIRSVLFFSLLLSCSAVLRAQESRTTKVYGYIEPYFCYDFNNPDNHSRPSHIYSYGRHNELSLNLGLIGVNVTDSTYRGNFALMAGSYTSANLANELPVFQHIFEANAGIRLRQRNNIWLDAGVLPSHIGFESAIGGNCATLSRSILADNTPYFETGIKLSGTNKSERWSFGLLILNGWQRIQQRDGNSMLSGGTQITFTPNEKLLVNSSTFLGTDEPDSTRKYRYFHNLYCVWKITDRFQLTGGFDIGLQQVAPRSSSYHLWHSAVVISSFQFNTKIGTALRAEYYHDPKNIIVNASPVEKFSVISFSANFDYRFNESVKWRLEFRTFQSETEIYSRNGNPVRNAFAICGAIAVSI